MNSIVKVNLGPRSYNIEIGVDILDTLATVVSKLGLFSQIAVITDTNVNTLYATKVYTLLTNQGYDVHLFVVPFGENSKSLPIALDLWEGMMNTRMDRQSLVIALGGGVVGDLSGFIAATYERGLRFFQIPTTLVAQVDSSVGGKVAINLEHGKNMVGAFHQPIGVLADPKTLLTLNDEQYRTGLGEVLKYGVSLDATFFEFLEKNIEAIRRRNLDTLSIIVRHCCQIKADIIEKDEKEESGQRALLNYGHTFAHAIESTAGYGHVEHGLAVSVGSIFAIKLARLLAEKGNNIFKAITPASVDRQLNLYKNLGMPTTLQDLGLLNIPIDSLLQHMTSDKKVDNHKICFILPIDLGKCECFTDVNLNDVQEILLRCQQKQGIINP